ncbi:MAG: class I SAM-dependent methyltransferase [Betaproteobacteria bacterium]|nr:class I SAM-dependent methyltransferase [Betaproteobacteria bacterium]
MTAANPQSCPVCGASAPNEVNYPGGNTRAGQSLQFTGIAICDTCELGFALPRPPQAALDRFYASGIYWTEVGRNLPQVMHEKAQCEQRVAACLPLIEKAQQLRVLDVGAGHGWTVDWVARMLPGRIARFDFIEPDDDAAKSISNKQPGFPLQRVHSMSDASDHYDLIFLNHVLEHVADPLAMIARITELLAPNGIAYIEMPHADYRFKSDVFPHTLFFTPASLAMLARKTGITQLACATFGRSPDEPGPAWRRRINWVLQRLFVLAARHGVWLVQRALDHAVWDYRPREPGIWLRWIIARPSRAN